MSTLQKLKNNLPLTMEEERAIKNLWHEIIHGQTQAYGDLLYNERIIVETLVETLARTTYPQFVEFLGYPKERLAHTEALLFDVYGSSNTTKLIEILKQDYADEFDLIVRSIGECVRGYREPEWYNVFQEKLKVIRRLLRDVFSF